MVKRPTIILFTTVKRTLHLQRCYAQCLQATRDSFPKWASFGKHGGVPHGKFPFFSISFKSRHKPGVVPKLHP